MYTLDRQIDSYKQIYDIKYTIMNCPKKHILSNQEILHRGN